MQFNNTFTVEAPIEEVYAALLDVERVAPSVPGAQVMERLDENTYRVGIRVKVGPMSVQYKGDVEIVERDPVGHRAVMRAKVKEARGSGTANADVRMQLSARDGSTHGDLTADVQLTGKVAAMGQGVISDVSARLIEQFATNLATSLAGEKPSLEPAPPAEPMTDMPSSGEAPPAAVSPEPAPPPPARPRPAPAAAENELDALALLGATLSRRLQDPRVLAVTLTGVALGAFLLGRNSRS